MLQLYRHGQGRQTCADNWVNAAPNIPATFCSFFHCERYHHCCDPCGATQCRAHGFAANSLNFRDVAGVSHYASQTPQKRPCRTYLATPLSLCRRRSSLQKRIALHGSVAATLTPTALHCATKMQSPSLCVYSQYLNFEMKSPPFLAKFR